MTLLKAIICDLDGTLCDHSHRLHFVKPCIGKDCKERFAIGSFSTKECTLEDGTKWKPDWDSFYAAMDQDTPNKAIENIINQSSYHGYDIVFLTGRPEKYSQITQDWLFKIGCPIRSNKYKLFMRPECIYPPLDPKAPDGTTTYRMDKSTPGPILKKWIYETEIKDKYDVLFVLEDDESCCSMYKSLGLTVLQVK